MTAWYILPPDAQHDSAEAHHDTAGWTLTAQKRQRPGTADDWLVFDVPDGTPDKNGCWLTIFDVYGKPMYHLHGVLDLRFTPESAMLGIDIFPKPPMQAITLPKLVVNGQFLGQADQ